TRPANRKEHSRVVETAIFFAAFLRVLRVLRGSIFSPFWPSRGGLRRVTVQVRQERGQQTDRRQESADLVDVLDAARVGQLAEQRGAEAAHAEREAEEQAGDHADLAGQ